MLIRTIDRAHPHSREENVVLRRLPAAAAGSSPLTLGKLIRLRHVGLIEGLIPAHAGKHPQHVAGNSPGGLIPAHAGKTPHWSRWTKSGRAHPRSRGENSYSSTRFHRYWGSSPLTRGKHRVRMVRDLIQGLIPAHAGKTRHTARQSPPPSAHPHSREENVVLRRLSAVAAGSSPLTRGKLIRLRHVGLIEGLIPAHAGKTSSFLWLLRRSAAHPHSRGENVT